MNIFMINLIAAISPTTIVGVVVLGVLLVGLLVFPSIMSKKRQKHVGELQNSVSVGDCIKTVGGIIGTVIEVNEISALEKEFVLETGVGDRKTTMVFDMQALYQNLTKIDAQREAAAASSRATQKKETEEEVFDTSAGEPDSK